MAPQTNGTPPHLKLLSSAQDLADLTTPTLVLGCGTTVGTCKTGERVLSLGFMIAVVLLITGGAADLEATAAQQRTGSRCVLLVHSFGNLVACFTSPAWVSTPASSKLPFTPLHGVELQIRTKLKPQPETAPTFLARASAVHRLAPTAAQSLCASAYVAFRWHFLPHMSMCSLAHSLAAATVSRVLWVGSFRPLVRSISCCLRTILLRHPAPDLQ